MAPNREGTEALIAEWMSRPWPNALDAPGDYYAEVVIPTLLAEVERLRGYAKDFTAMYDDLYRCGWLNADLIERYGAPARNARRALGAAE